MRPAKLLGTTASRPALSSRRRRRLSIALLIVLVGSFGPLARAQLYSGSATGLVTDPSGAVVPQFIEYDRLDAEMTLFRLREL